VNTVSLVVGLFIGILLVVFGAQNAQLVSIHFFGWQTSSVPLVLALGLALLVGMLLSFILSIPSRFQGMRQRRALQRRIDAQEQWTTSSAEQAGPVARGDEEQAAPSA
jgi:uncharacterized integral membrane protein